MFWPLPALMDSECHGFFPKTEILNPVTQHRNNSMGSPTAAKRGYDTESVHDLSRMPPPRSLCGRVGIRLSHSGREESPRTTVKTSIWWPWYVTYWVISVFDIETCLSYICHMCLNINGQTKQNKYGVFPGRRVCVSVCVLVKPASWCSTTTKLKWNCGKQQNKNCKHIPWVRQQFWWEKWRFPTSECAALR